MRSAYTQVPPVPGRRWHLLGPGIGTALVTAAGIALESADALPAPVVAPPVLPVASVVEVLAVAAATLGPLLLAWRRPVAAAVLQTVAAAVLVVVSSIAVWGLAGPAVALAVAVGVRTAHHARAQAFATWPRVPRAPLDDAARRAVDHGTRLPPLVVAVVRVVGAVLLLVGLVWTGLDMSRVHAFRTDPATVTTTGTVVELLDDDLYATLEVDGTRVTVEILTAPPAIGAELPVRVSTTSGRAELLGTPFDPAGALFWSALGIVVLVALRHRVHDGHALAQVARGAGTPLTLVRADDTLTLVDQDGRTVGRLDAVTMLGDPEEPPSPDDTPVNPEAAAEAEQLLARIRTLSERAADELDDDELLEIYRAESRLEELDAVLDPMLETLLADGARTDVTLHVLPATGDAIVRTSDMLLRSVVLSPPRDPATVTPTVDAPTSDGSAHVTEPQHPTGPLAATARWIGDHDGLPMLAVHAVVMGIVWWFLDEPDSGWWDALRAAVIPAYLLHVTWLVRPAVGIGRTRLHMRERLRVQHIPWREVTEITAHDATVIVRTLTDGTSDAIVLAADPRSALVPLARCRDAQDTTARLRDAWAAGCLLAPTGPRWLPSLPLLLACAWVGVLVASVLV